MSEKDGSNKRIHPRSALTLLVQYHFESLDEVVCEYAEDVSLGGMFIKTATPPAKGSVIFLQFSLSDGSKLVEGLAKVAWCLSPAEAEASDRVAGMGVQFIHFDEESKAVVEEIVQRLDAAEAEARAAEAAAEPGSNVPG